MAVDRWLHSFRRAWEASDADAVVELFTDDAIYRSAPFVEPHVGRAAIHAYWDRVTVTQALVQVELAQPLVDGFQAVVEWWTTMTDADAAGDVTLPGVLILDFDDEVRCTALREYWAQTQSRHDPFVEWGRLAGGDTRRTRRFAQRWADAYADAWRRLDVDAVVALFADDVVYRSHPFRTPQRGHDGVRRYTEQWFSAESAVEAHLRVVAVAGGCAAVEYWTPRLENGRPRTIAGLDVLTFERDGQVRALREYWHETDDLFAPDDTWPQASTPPGE